MKSIFEITRRHFGESTGPVLKTALNNFHKLKGAKMVPFAGYDMPVKYPLGTLKEHLHCRESAGIFDVSHMGQLLWYGKDAVKFLEKMVVGDIASLKSGEVCVYIFVCIYIYVCMQVYVYMSMHLCMFVCVYI